MEQCNLNILCNTTAAWDAVVTCFFLDTAHNIVEYIEIISKVLKDGGVSSSALGIIMNYLLFVNQLQRSSEFSDFCKLIIVKAVLRLIFILCVNFNQQVWINLGPLLYHFADSYGPDYVIY